jgi:hypothetical protein
MAKSREATGVPEVDAIGAVYAALKDIDPTAQVRVLRYAAQMLGVILDVGGEGSRSSSEDEESRRADSLPASTAAAQDTRITHEIDGINAVALRWVRRSGLSAENLQSLFSLGIDEIDLVAKAVPGSKKKERMRSVLLLKGIAAYLGTGAARVTYEQLKEACLHYDAYDASNFASYLRSFSGDVGGTKEAGFTLTARGLTAGTNLLKEMLGSK